MQYSSLASVSICKRTALFASLTTDFEAGHTKDAHVMFQERLTAVNSCFSVWAVR